MAYRIPRSYRHTEYIAIRIAISAYIAVFSRGKKQVAVKIIITGDIVIYRNRTEQFAIRAVKRFMG